MILISIGLVALGLLLLFMLQYEWYDINSISAKSKPISCQAISDTYRVVYIFDFVGCTREQETLPLKRLRTVGRCRDGRLRLSFRFELCLRAVLRQILIFQMLRDI